VVDDLEVQPSSAAKAYAYWMTVNYREAYGLFAANGLLFNHESPRRGEAFVTRNFTRAVACIYAGQQKKLYSTLALSFPLFCRPDPGLPDSGRLAGGIN